MDHSAAGQLNNSGAKSLESESQSEVEVRVLSELKDLRTRTRRETNIDELKAEVYSKVRGIERIFAGVA